MNAKFLSVVGLALALVLAQTHVVLARTNTIFILDGSNSMWGRVDGVPKIDLAQRLLGNLLGNVPADMRIGLVSYGHKRKADCNDITLLSPIGTGNPATWKRQLQSVVPKGKTPIAKSLELAAKQFTDPNDDNNIVLISDGVATCPPDPCAVAAELASRDIKVRIHVVGYDVKPNERKELQCIAEATGGRYFRAGDTEGLRNALARASDIPPPEPVATAQPAPEPPPAALHVVLDKSQLIRLARDAKVVMVANPDIADVVIESPRRIFLIGRSPGETNLFALDAKGNEIIQTPVVVVPNPVREVTINRRGSESTLSCMPRCASIPTPDGTNRAQAGGDATDALGLAAATPGGG